MNTLTPSLVYGVPASWVIVRRENGQAVLETFSAKIAGAIDGAKFKAVPILEYLQGLNRK